jgi:hypothetical protein
MWFILALLAAGAYAASRPSSSVAPGAAPPRTDDRPLGPGGTLMSLPVKPPAVDASAPLADQLVAHAKDFLSYVDDAGRDLNAVIAAQAAGNRAAVNSALGKSGNDWKDLSSYQVSFITKLVGAFTGTGAGSAERMLILAQNESTTDAGLSALENFIRLEAGYTPALWATARSYISNAIKSNVPPYIGVQGQDIRDYIYGQTGVLTASAVADIIIKALPVDGLDPELAKKVLAGTLSVDDLPIDETKKAKVRELLPAASELAKSLAKTEVLKGFSPDALVAKYVTLPTPGAKTRDVLGVIANGKVNRSNLIWTAIETGVPGTLDKIDALLAAIPSEVRALVRLYLTSAGDAAMIECKARGLCSLVSAFDNLPADQRTAAFTALGRLRPHLASHAPVAAAFGLLAAFGENWTVYAPTSTEINSGSFRAALEKGLTSGGVDAAVARQRALRYEQFFGALVAAIATTTANDNGVPLFGWRSVYEMTWAGWDAGIEGARASVYPWPGTSGVAFAGTFAQKQSEKIKAQVGA